MLICACLLINVKLFSQGVITYTCGMMPQMFQLPGMMSASNALTSSLSRSVTSPRAMRALSSSTFLFSVPGFPSQWLTTCIISTSGANIWTYTEKWAALKPSPTEMQRTRWCLLKFYFHVGTFLHLKCITTFCAWKKQCCVAYVFCDG